MKGWLWTPQELLQRWQQPKQGRLFLFMTRKDYEQFKHEHPQVKTYLIGQTLKNVVISNQENPQ